MARELIWSPAAKLDLKGIFQFIAENNPPAAYRVIEEIIATIEQLQDFAESGRVVPEFEEHTVREIIKVPYRIVYRLKLEQNTIEVVRVWHSARGIPKI